MQALPGAKCGELMPPEGKERRLITISSGGLIPIKGRDIMVQGKYQGGISVMEITDPDHPKNSGDGNRERYRISTTAT